MRALAFAMTLLATPALADGCNTVAELKKGGGHWELVTPKQQAFLTGIFVMHPLTPADLPVGDKVFIVTKDGGAIVTWTDSSETLSCSSMPVTKQLLDLLPKLGKGGGDDL